MKKVLALFIVFSILFSVAACSGNNTDAVITDPVTETEETTAEVYAYDLKNYDGYVFTILNASCGWGGTYHLACTDELNGEGLNDAIYNRNMLVEDTLGIKMTEVVIDDLSQLYKYVSNAVMADDDSYDIAYVPLNLLTGSGSTLLTGEYTYNVFDISTINLGEEWWNQSFIESVATGDNCLYMMIDYVSLMSYTWVISMIFNVQMAKDYSLESPYDLVRSGGWTYDKMNEMMTSVISLNGDSSFSAGAKQGANATYGLVAAHSGQTRYLIFGSGEFFVTKDSDNYPMIADSYERLYSVYEKLQSILSGDGSCVYINSTFHANNLFEEGRALFQVLELGSVTNHRDSDTEYGLLPIPKYAPDQEKYYNTVSESAFSLAIPLSNKDPERTGAIVDYLNYESYHSVLPELQSALTYKELRDEDSLEMLDIILETRVADIGYMYGWTKSLMDTLAVNLNSSKSIIASTVAKQTEKIKIAMEETMTLMFGSN